MTNRWRQKTRPTTVGGGPASFVRPVSVSRTDSNCAKRIWFISKQLYFFWRITVSDWIGVIVIVIVISEFLERHSKAMLTRAPAYSRALALRRRKRVRSSWSQIRHRVMSVSHSFALECHRGMPSLKTRPYESIYRLLNNSKSTRTNSAQIGSCVVSYPIN